MYVHMYGELSRKPSRSIIGDSGQLVAKMIDKLTFISGISRKYYNLVAECYPKIGANADYCCSDGRG